MRVVGRLCYREARELVLEHPMLIGALLALLALALGVVHLPGI